MIGIVGALLGVGRRELLGWSLVAHQDYPKVGVCDAIASHDELQSVVEFIFFVHGRLWCSRDRRVSQWIVGHGRDVHFSCGVSWEARDVELTGMGGLNLCLVGQLDINSLAGGDLFATWIVDVQKIPCASGVHDG
jgi:hypothetical protein